MKHEDQQGLSFRITPQVGVENGFKIYKIHYNVFLDVLVNDTWEHDTDIWLACDVSTQADILLYLS